MSAFPPFHEEPLIKEMIKEEREDNILLATLFGMIAILIFAIWYWWPR